MDKQAIIYLYNQGKNHQEIVARLITEARVLSVEVTYEEAEKEVIDTILMHHRRSDSIG